MDYLALDIGGTSIKYGIIDDEGNIKESYCTDTDAAKGSHNLINNIFNIIESMIKDKEIKGIGISTAGQVNSITGEIIFATEAFPGWTGVQLKKIVEEKFNILCYVDNDVNCAALGDMWKGSAKDSKDFICLTLGTGIGGAIVLDGNLYRGNNFIAGEFGHMTIYKDGEKCNCGGNGCFERYASTSALILRAKRELNLSEDSNINGKIIFEKVVSGEKDYIKIVDEWAYYVALGLKNIIYIFNPSLIIIGGGVSAQGELLISLIESQLKKIIMPSFLNKLSIKVSKCGNNAGMLGAVCGLKKSKDKL